MTICHVSLPAYWSGAGVRTLTSTIIETERLFLRETSGSDAEFIIELFNDPTFIRYVGDRGIRNKDDAISYLNEGPLQSYQDHGFGLYCVVRRDDKALIGMCGLLQREQFESPDIGYNFLPDFRGQGYALEAAAGTVEFAKKVVQGAQLLAIVNADNRPSITLLEKLDFAYTGEVEYPPGEPPSSLYGLKL